MADFKSLMEDYGAECLYPSESLSKRCHDFWQDTVTMASIAWVKSLKRWRVRWRATNKVTHRVFSGSRVFFEKPEAYRYFAEVEAQERLWRTGQVESLDSIQEVAQDFESYCKRHTQRTQELYRSVVGRFLQSLPTNVLRIQQLDSKCIEEYLYRLRDAGGINRTQNAHLTVIKAFCRYFSDRYNLPNPASKVAMLTEDPPEARFITHDEYVKALAVAHPQIRDRMAFIANTGLRASEFCSLVRSGGLSQLATSITVVGKGRRRRTLPLNQKCRDILQRPYIYKRTGRHTLLIQLYRVAKRAGIPRFGVHSLRHYCATRLLLKGIPPAKVAKILGHSIRVLEQTYAHILPADLQGTTDVLDD